MGEVYRAHDTKLGRDVAIKVLPPAFADDVLRMARFEREAHVLASLNHPNIAAIYGIEQGALVMELVAGSTLAERLAAAAVPIEEALPIARQVAEGLEAAHDHGIVHRDLKPANVKITPQGVVKLLDFGLAKVAGEAAAAAGQLTSSPTLSMWTTQAGTILGIAAYMSPEQARGKPADRRADIWAFGVVLYEMLSGRPLFGSGATMTDIIAAVVTREPDWSALPTSTPPHIRRLLERCLRKDVKTRLQAIGEARIAIDEQASTPSRCSSAGRNARPPVGLGCRYCSNPGCRRRLVACGSSARAAPAGAGERRNIAGHAGDGRQYRRDAGPIPDGMRLVVTLRGADGKVRLYTRRLDESQLTPLAGTEGGSSPFFSPDGRWIGFGADRKIKKISVEGGAAVTLCDAGIVRGASWGDDGNIVFGLTPSPGLLRVSADGGTPETLTKLNPGEVTHRWPQVLAGSQVVLFTAHSGTVNYDGANIDVLSLKTGQRKTVQRGGFYGYYVASQNGPGQLIYLQQNTLFAAPFNLARLELTGPTVPVLKDVASSVFGGGDFTLSGTGLLSTWRVRGSKKTWPSRGWTAPVRYSRCIPSPARTSRPVFRPTVSVWHFRRGARGDSTSG